MTILADQPMTELAAEAEDAHPSGPCVLCDCGAHMPLTAVTRVGGTVTLRCTDCDRCMWLAGGVGAAALIRSRRGL